jgi:hypothetical protein
MLVIGHKTYPAKYKSLLKEGNQSFLLFMVKLFVLGSESEFPMRIQESQINADPCGFGSTTLLQDADIILIVVL